MIALDFESRIQEAKRWVKEAKRIVFLGGAGVSTDSGIPDFRSPQGLYHIQSKYGVPYEEMLSHDYFFAHPETFYSFYWESMVREGALPNKAHLALAEFEKRHPYSLTIVTQNIDGLHQKAGSKRVLEAHGSIRKYHCLDCGREYTLDQIPHHGVPLCSCGGILKPDVVLYGEALGEYVLLSSVNAVRFASLLIVGGTSMRVQPMASLPEYFSGKSIEINTEETPFSPRADLIFREDIGEVLSHILEV